MSKIDNQESEEYLVVPKSKLVALKSSIEEYAKENYAIKKDFEKLRRRIKEVG